MLLRICLAALFAVTFVAQAVASESKLNFVVLISDDQRWDQVSYADQPIIPELNTKNLDRLAADGVSFRNAFVTTPICCVSRASIATGRYVSTHGMNHFRTDFAPGILGASYPSVLRKAGYKTAMLGKWGIGTKGTEEVFDHFNAWTGQGSYFHDTEDGKIHNSEWLAMRSREFMESCGDDQPFCLTVCYKAPHHPYQPDPRDTRLFEGVNFPYRKTDTPESYAAIRSDMMEKSLNRWCYFDERKDPPTKDKFEKDFLRCIMSLDRSVGQIMKSLEELKLDENTVVIFLSDHGCLWGEHGLGGKWLLYEESIRIPMIIRMPGLPNGKHGAKLNQFALNIDVAPTILDLAGVEIPDEMDGMSLKPAITVNASTREDFFMEHVGVVKARNPIPDSEGVRTTDWKYIRYLNVEPEIEELYHLKTDPLEQKNLAGDDQYREAKERMANRYLEYSIRLRVKSE